MREKTRLKVIASAPRVNGYVASNKTGQRLGRVSAINADSVQVDGVWVLFSAVYPCEAPDA